MQDKISSKMKLVVKAVSKYDFHFMPFQVILHPIKYFRSYKFGEPIIRSYAQQASTDCFQSPFTRNYLTHLNICGPGIVELPVQAASTQGMLQLHVEFNEGWNQHPMTMNG